MKTRLHTLIAFAFVALVPGLAAADWQAGVEAFENKQYTAAREAFEAVVAGQPTFAGGHLMLGRSLLELDRAEEAIASLKQAHSLAPDDLQTRLLLARVQLDRAPAATASLLESVDTKGLPKRTATYVLRTLATAFERSDRRTAALAPLRDLVTLAPTAAHHGILAAAAARAGRPEEARTAYAKGVALAPADADLRLDQMRFVWRRAKAAAADARTAPCAEAADVAKAASALDDSAEVLTVLAHASRCAGRAEDARQAFETVLARDPGQWQSAISLASLASEAEDWTVAEDRLKQALEIAPGEEQARIWEKLGYLYERQDDYDRALDAYGRAGNQDAVARVEVNRGIERDERELAALEAQQQAIQDELEALGDGRP